MEFKLVKILGFGERNWHLELQRRLFNQTHLSVEEVSIGTDKVYFSRQVLI